MPIKIPTSLLSLFSLELSLRFELRGSLLGPPLQSPVGVELRELIPGRITRSARRFRGEGDG